MREETGLEVEPFELLTVFDRIERDGERVLYHYVIVDYLCRWRSGEARAASDALDVAWARPDELEQYDLPAKALEVVAGRVSPDGASVNHAPRRGSACASAKRGVSCPWRGSRPGSSRRL